MTTYYALGSAKALATLGLIKTAADAEEQDTLSDTERLLYGGLLGAGGVSLMPQGLEHALGSQRIYHGTSDEAAQSILREGLQPRHGGSPTGSAAATGFPNFIENSKGRIHVGTGPRGRTIAQQHAALSEAARRARAEGRTLSPEEAMHIHQNPFTQKHKGRTLEAAVPYEEFQKGFETDPDFRSILGGVDFAHRSERPVSSEHFKKNKFDFRHLFKGRTRNFKQYIKNNPKRFYGGLAGLAAGPAALTGAYYLTKPVFSESKEKKV